MNNKYLAWSATATLIILSIFLLASTAYVSDTATSANTVSFSGQGKVMAKPDIAVINASIVTQAATPKAAQNDNSAKSKKVVEFLKKQNIDEKDIKTSSYNIFPQYRYPQFGGQPTITGYQVNQSLEVKIRDLDKVSDVLDGLVSAGAEQVNNLGLQVEDPEKLKTEARKMAIEDAKNKADELKDEVGIRLGKIVNFMENTGGYPIPLYAFDKEGRGMGGGGGPDVPAGENEIVVSVTITYQIK